MTLKETIAILKTPIWRYRYDASQQRGKPLGLSRFTLQPPQFYAAWRNVLVSVSAVAVDLAGEEYRGSRELELPTILVVVLSDP